MRKRIVAALVGGLLLLALAVPALGGGSAEAFSNGGGESSSAPGQANAIANCFAVIASDQPDGDETGNDAHDGKTLGTAVTNCDHFWGP